jgi:hypothetical protein
MYDLVYELDMFPETGGTIQTSSGLTLETKKFDESEFDALIVLGALVDEAAKLMVEQGIRLTSSHTRPVLVAGTRCENRLSENSSTRPRKFAVTLALTYVCFVRNRRNGADNLTTHF